MIILPTLVHLLALLFNTADIYACSNVMLFVTLCYYRGAVRYNYTHAIPQTGSVSCFQDRTIVRDRRISVISRTHPP